MILQKYVIKNILSYLFFILSILVALFLVIAYFHFVREAAAAKLNPKDITKIIITEIPVLLQPILPLGFFISILLVFRNMLFGNELMSMYALGMSNIKIFKPVIILGICLSLFSAFMQLYVFPRANNTRIHLLEDSIHKVAFDKVFPGHFIQLGADQVVYVDKKLSKINKLEGVFYSMTLPDKNNRLSYDIIVAKSLEERILADKSKFIVFFEGVRYTANLDNLESLIVNFEKFALRISRPIYRLEDWPGCMETRELFKLANKDRYAAAEFHWRISIPLSVMNLTFFAIAFNYGRTRGYAKLFTTFYPLLVYLIYVNLLLTGMGFIKSEILNRHLGLWWIHGAMAMFCIFTFRYRPD